MKLHYNTNIHYISFIQNEHVEMHTLSLQQQNLTWPMKQRESCQYISQKTTGCLLYYMTPGIYPDMQIWSTYHVKANMGTYKTTMSDLYMKTVDNTKHFPTCIAVCELWLKKNCNAASRQALGRIRQAEFIEAACLGLASKHTYT